MLKPNLLTASAMIAVMGVSSIGATNASAHDRHNAKRHFNQSHYWDRQQHREFHRQWGKGQHGVHNYYEYSKRKAYKKKRKKNDKRDLIAAGIIGLAVGAIIASEAAKHKQNTQPTFNYGSPQPYLGSHQHSQRGHIPLDQYGSSSGHTYKGQQTYQEPHVITYNEPTSLEPWTPGWQAWCEENYRSFNSKTGTFLGYDGQYHFCVPKQ